MIKIRLLKSNRKATVFASCVVPTMPLFPDLLSPWQSYALSHGPKQRRESVLVGHIDVYPSPKKRIPGEFIRLCHILFRSGFQSSSVVPWEVCHPRSRPLCFTPVELSKTGLCARGTSFPPLHIVLGRVVFDTTRRSVDLVSCHYCNYL